MAVTRMIETAMQTSHDSNGDKIMRKSAIVFLALASSACTSLEVRPVNLSDDKTRIGIPYEIPMTQFEIELEYTLKSCGAEPQIAIAAKVVQTRNLPDPTHRYSINPDSLQSIFKTSDVKVEFHPNGSVKALNASAEDKTGEVIASVGSAAVKIAKFVAIPAGPATEGCKNGYTEILADLATKETDLDTETTDVASKLKQLTAIREKVTAMSGAVDAGTAAELSKAIDALKVAVARQKKAQQAYDKVKEQVTYKSTIFWPGAGDPLVSERPLPGVVLAQWLNAFDDPLSLNRSKVYFVLSPLVPFEGAATTKVPKIGASSGREKLAGIPFRKPEQGRLLICKGAKCGEDGSEQLIDHRALVHQLGAVYALPCTSRPFTSISCSLEWTEEGVLKQVGSAHKAAAADGIARAVGSVADSAAQIKTALDPDEIAKIKSKTDLVKAQADYQTALKALAEPAADPTADEIADLTKKANLAKAKLVLIEAEAALVAKQP